ncbi:MAG: hypothetical protein L6R43_06245 [Planctomycetes bacterium]|nr:hypothetical protein [Planctomycetota bacterium]
MGGRGAVLLALCLAACGEGEPAAPAAAPPPASAPLVEVPSRAGSPSAPAPPPDAPRGPAGEVPPHSRRPHDAEGGGASSPTEPEFDLAVPGPAGSGFHYHLRVRPGGGARVLASGSGGGASLRVVLVRVAGAAEAALRVRRALDGTVESAEILDPAVAGGCGGGDAHRAPGSLPVPASRVVRTLPRGDGIAAAAAAAAKAAGGEAALEAEVGGTAGGRPLLDLVLVE